MKERIRWPICSYVIFSIKFVKYHGKISPNIVDTSYIHMCINVCVMYIPRIYICQPASIEFHYGRLSRRRSAKWTRSRNSHSECARPIAWSVVSKCTYGQICDSNFCHVPIAENNLLLTVPTPLSTMNISHSLITIPEASINGILINANNANPSGAIIKLCSYIIRAPLFTHIHPLIFNCALFYFKYW